MFERFWLSKRRNEKNLTILETARKSGLSKQGYWFIETGRRDPSVKTAKRIADVLEFDWTFFFR
ncbi:helix-turn-helix transcriptional regulator [Listeria monocytogenes]|nr:XRE family transcriptional regulator [Listeria monocytogenes]EJC6460100.1 helix-turn-helix transcriptional regulator [Listeria monocytogenes]